MIEPMVETSDTQPIYRSSVQVNQGRAGRSFRVTVYDGVTRDELMRMAELALETLDYLGEDTGLEDDEEGRPFA